MRIFGSFSQEPSKETEYVSAVDDTERVGSGFRHLEELRPSRFADSFGYARLQGGLSLGLTDTETFSLKNARNITEALAEVFPDDPCLGDFALFGSGVNGVL